MLIDIKNGQTSVVFRVKLRDSSVTTGAGLTGLTSASSGMIISTIADNEATATAYTVAASNVETIATLGTYAAPTASKCRFKEVDATNHPGVYEIHLADARFAVASAKSLLVSIIGATNLVQTDILIPLRSVDPYDSVRFGMTALPNAAAAASGGVLINGSNTGTVTLAALTVTGAQTNTGGIVGDITGNLSGSVGSVTGAVGSVTGAVGSVTGSVGSVASGGIASTSFAAGAITAAAIADAAIDTATFAAGTTIPRCTLTDTLTTYTNNTPQTGDAYAKVDTEIASLITAVDAVPTATEITDAILVKAVPTSNTANTIADCLNAARAQGFGPWAKVGTSLILYAADGTTVVRTFTLDSSTAPTTRT